MKLKQELGAYAGIENSHRQTQFWAEGVVYAKLKTYCRGLAKNVAYFKRNLDTLNTALDTAMIGKYDHTDQVERDQVATVLMKRRVSDDRA